MSMEMMENDHPHDKQGLMSDNTDGDQGLRLKTHESNKHSYFLRAKTPRFLGFQVANEDGDNQFKKPSSISRVVGMDRERPNSSFLPSSRSRTTDQYGDHTSLSEEEDLANCLVMLSSNKSQGDDKEESNKVVREVVEKGSFQCKACKKVFSSHQALGGHRASHKKVKGCFASKVEGNINDEDSIIIDDQESIGDEQEAPPSEAATASRKRAKMHECSVCRRVFSSGQALGGHKRCHWLTTSTDNAFIPNFHDFQYDHRTQQLCKKAIFTNHDQNQTQEHQLDLNLNLPPASHHERNLDGDGDGDGGGGGDKRSKYEESTKLCLQQWTDAKTGNDAVTERKSEEGCGMKLRKLSDLRDVNLDGGWLQMGIPSITQMR